MATCRSAGRPFLKPSRQHPGLRQMQRQLALSWMPGLLPSGVLPLCVAAHPSHWHTPRRPRMACLLCLVARAAEQCHAAKILQHIPLMFL